MKYTITVVGFLLCAWFFTFHDTKYVETQIMEHTYCMVLQNTVAYLEKDNKRRIYFKSKFYFYVKIKQEFKF